ncbi:restriction endonuclease subunit S [Shewanella xiamenensis]
MDGVNVSYAGAISDHLDLWTAAVRPKSSAGRGSNSKLELTGIKKLRELILELAVRGKLVPQDPSDEPASVLLERITAEKAQLVKEGKIKMPKALPEIGEEEKQFELPKGWAWCRLNDIINISSGDGLTSKQMAVDGDIPVFGGNGITGYHDKYNVSQPTLVIGRVGFYCGSVHITPQKAWVTDNAFVTKFSYLNIDINFLFLLLKATDLNENDNATAQPVISGRKLYPIVVCLPPLSEQHSIVTKVDELMALCDQLEQCSESQLAAHQTLVEALLGYLLQPSAAAEGSLTDSGDADELAQNWARLSTHFDTLFTTEASIDALKQTILQLAVMGKLVPQDPSDEPASALLERIAAKKAQLVKEKKIKKEKPLPAISEDEKPFELPQGWEWARLGNIGICSTGKTPSTGNSAFYDGEIPFIGPGQITPSGKLLAAEKYLSDVGLELSSEANAGDILMVCIGGSIGKATICDRQIGFNQQINSIRPILCDSYFLLAAMTTKAFTNLLLERATGSATPIINRSKWEEIPIPISPYQEQLRIISRVHELMTLCDQLKSRLQTSLQTQLALAESLVEGALA